MALQFIHYIKFKLNLPLKTSADWTEATGPDLKLALAAICNAAGIAVGNTAACAGGRFSGSCEAMPYCTDEALTR